MSYIKQMIGRLFPTRFKTSLRTLMNRLHPDESIEESKTKWKQLAEKNANYFVLSDFGEDITEEQFSTSGKGDYESLVQRDPFFKGLGPLHSKRILEIGCGTGRMTEFMAQDFQEVDGIDIAEEMIEKARKRIGSRENIHLSATDGLHLPFADACFDAVFSYIVFRHMPDYKTVKTNIEETARVLKTGGLAKIQLRGRPTERGKWFSGSSFTMPQVESMIEEIPLQILKTEGAETRSFWVWFQKV